MFCFTKKTHHFLYKKFLLNFTLMVFFEAIFFLVPLIIAHNYWCLRKKERETLQTIGLFCG